MHPRVGNVASASWCRNDGVRVSICITDAVHAPDERDELKQYGMGMGAVREVAAKTGEWCSSRGRWGCKRELRRVERILSFKLLEISEGEILTSYCAKPTEREVGVEEGKTASPRAR
jgi:hypothetical protein